MGHRAELQEFKEQITKEVGEIVTELGKVAAKVGKEFDDRLDRLEADMEECKAARGVAKHVRTTDMQTR